MRTLLHSLVDIHKQLKRDDHRKDNGDMSPTLFIDFEAFQCGEEDFQIKELCILDAAAPLKPLYFMFKPSLPWDALNRDQKRTYAYQEHHVHHLSWNEGFRRYCRNCVAKQIERVFPLVTVNSICYVLGKQKVEYLQRELPMLNISEYEHATSYNEILPAPAHLTCYYRNHSRKHCAVLKCYQLLSHYESL